MSFRCEITGKVVQGERLNRVVMETRARSYKDEEGNEIATGTEIVREANVSAEGLKILQDRAVKES